MIIDRLLGLLPLINRPTANCTKSEKPVETVGKSRLRITLRSKLQGNWRLNFEIRLRPLD